jgi:hypothetical protein
MVMEGGEPVFLADVAHIVAATAAGPRGTEKIADRESFENLLLLCARHHRVIDDAATRDRYPVRVLKGWKAQREAGFDSKTLDELARLRVDMPTLLVKTSQDITARLDQTITTLETTGELTQELANLFHVAIANATRSVPGVGDGPTGIKEIFEAAYDAAGGASFLGLPSSEAVELEPGFIQHLRGAGCGHAAVICALRGRDAVVITADAWDGIRRVGGGSAGSGAHLVGLPPHAAGGISRYIGPDVAQIPTLGGAWGSGLMKRQADGLWRWKADLAFDSNAASDTDLALARESPMDVRLRLVSYASPSDDQVRLSSAGRRRLSAALNQGAFTDLVTRLALGRVGVPQDLEWNPQDDGFGRNDSFGASYQCLITGADGRPAIRGTAQYLMPHLFVGQVAAVVDLEVDFTDMSPSTPISLSELVDSFSVAWSIAHDALPLAMADGESSLDAGRPRVSLHVISERPPNTQARPVGELVDLSPFGITTKKRLSQLSLAVLGRGSMAPDERRTVVRAAIIRMAEDAGFVDADLVRW